MKSFQNEPDMKQVAREDSYWKCVIMCIRFYVTCYVPNFVDLKCSSTMLKLEGQKIELPQCIVLLLGLYNCMKSFQNELDLKQAAREDSYWKCVIMCIRFYLMCYVPTNLQCSSAMLKLEGQTIELPNNVLFYCCNICTTTTHKINVSSL